MAVVLQKLLNPYFGETLNSLALLFIFFCKGSATLGVFTAHPKFFFLYFFVFFTERRVKNYRCLSSKLSMHPSLASVCVRQKLSLWSRQTRDKEVSERTLASLGISFTGVEGGAHSLIRQQIGAMCSVRQQNSCFTAGAERAALADEHQRRSASSN